jgi:hypothetical protein
VTAHQVDSPPHHRFGRRPAVIAECGGVVVRLGEQQTLDEQLLQIRDGKSMPE